MNAFDLTREGWQSWLNGLLADGDVLLALAVLPLFLLGWWLAALHKSLVTLPAPAEPVLPPAPPEQRDIVEDLPLPVWWQEPDQPPDGNRLFRQCRTKLAGTPAGERVYLAKGDLRGWFAVHETGCGRKTLHYGVPADALVEQERKHLGLLETLATTFSILPDAITVFDPDGTLTLFNPATATLLGLDPAWLAHRPTLDSLLDRLRNAGVVPEAGAFKTWRRIIRQMADLEESDIYNGRWQLPDGRMLHVTGQKTRSGATALLFEDISARLEAERNAHRTRTLGKALLDHLDEPVAVFDTTGRAILANTAFAQFAGTADETVSTDNLGGKLPESLLSALRKLVSRSDSTPAWMRMVEGRRPRVANVFALPQGATGLLVSREMAKGANTGNPLFVPKLPREPVNNGTVQMSDPLNLEGLTGFARERHVVLDLTALDPEMIPETGYVKIRRILWYLVLAAANLCRDDGRIRLSSETTDSGISFTCALDEADILPARDNRLSLNLLRQLVMQAGGGVDWIIDHTARPLTISCVLPVATPVKAPVKLANTRG